MAGVDRALDRGVYRKQLADPRLEPALATALRWRGLLTVSVVQRQRSRMSPLIALAFAVPLAMVLGLVVVLRTCRFIVLQTGDTKGLRDLAEVDDVALVFLARGPLHAGPAGASLIYAGAAAGLLAGFAAQRRSARSPRSAARAASAMGSHSVSDFCPAGRSSAGAVSGKAGHGVGQSPARADDTR